MGGSEDNFFFLNVKLQNGKSWISFLQNHPVLSLQQVKSSRLVGLEWTVGFSGEEGCCEGAK